MPLELDEETHRLPNFRPGHKVRIQGQDWTLRLPDLVISPEITDGIVGDVRVGPRGVADYEETLAILYGETRVNPREYWQARFRCLAALLQGNYDLTDSELTALLTSRDNDPEAEDLHAAALAVFAGEIPDPKPEPAGC